jgi:hypothetical protein
MTGHRSLLRAAMFMVMAAAAPAVCDATFPVHVAPAVEAGSALDVAVRL